MDDDKQKIACEDCGWHGISAQTLSAPNPFEPEYLIYGCPECKSIETFYVACQHDGCWDKASSGTPLKDGSYVWACHRHVPDKSLWKNA